MTGNGGSVRGDDRPSARRQDLQQERDLLAVAQELVQVGVWDWVVDSGDLWWSDEVYRIFGVTPHEIAPTYEAFIDFVHPDDGLEVWHYAERVMAGAGEREHRHRVLRPDGSVRYVVERMKVIEEDDGRPVRVLGTIIDITEDTLLEQERDAAVAALVRSEEQYRLLTENAYDVIWTMALDGSITYVSPSVERVRGFTPVEAALQPLEEIHPPEYAQITLDYFTRLLGAIAAGTELPTFHGETQYYRKDGSIMWGELQVTPQLNADGEVVQILGVTRDISRRKHFETELSRLAVTDPLTGAWNRRHGEALFTADLAEARRYGPPLSLLMLDIDHFKHVNDTFGHQAGDHVLVELTHRLESNLRASDVLVRWGGEEFVVMMRHCTIDDAVPLAEKLRALVADGPFGEVGTVTISIGASQLRPEDDLATWLRRADQAMYAAKIAGRNTVRTDS